MLAPVIWLVVSSLQDDLQLATGAYDLFHPTFDAFTGMWRTIDFERFFLNSMLICTASALLATAFASSAGYALAPFRFRGSRAFGMTVIGTQIPGSMFLLPLFVGFIWLKQNGRRAALRHAPGHDPRVHGVLHAGGDLLHALVLPRDPARARGGGDGRRLHAVRRVRQGRAAAPGLVATFVYAFLFAWDELFVANLTQDTAETIPIGIRTFIGNYQQRTALLAAESCPALPSSSRSSPHSAGW